MSITRNRNFTSLKCKLEELGVQDNEFILRVKDQRVLDLDPFDENLDETQQSIIMQEAIGNLYYFLGECVKIKVIGKDEPDDFNLNLANLKALYTAEKGFNTYLTSPRQLYGTITFCAFTLWKCLKNRSDVDFKYSIITHNTETLRYLFRRIKDVICLPPFIKDMIGDIKQSFIPVDVILNQIKHPSTVDPIKVDFIFIDDFEMFPYKKFKCIMDLISMCTQDRFETQFIFKTTVGKKGSCGRSAGDAIAMTADRFRNELFDIKNFLVTKRIMYINECYDNLVDDPEIWYNKMYSLLDGHEDTIRREVLCSRLGIEVKKPK